jgi:hypothetical protein
MLSEFSSAPFRPLLNIAIPTYNRAANLDLVSGRATTANWMDVKIQIAGRF